MARTTAVLLLALSSLVPSVVSVPVLAQEECVCKPLEGQTFSNSSLASCNKIAEGIQQWRAVAFHSPYLADAFVDAEQGLRVFRDGKLYKWATQSAPVALGGDEKRIYALYSIEEEEFEDAVVPAISDL
ncbi:hypothetical protein EG327_003403 [Venturia inaequalis]|uniref:Uncharacterized protein n=1 Tax=Venturia inaequalis TaxID=5025 RepID=A0A8H3VFW5_VENIN|nr:hypothetical protein EG327_003403 [Venturia inaequalis]